MTLARRHRAKVKRAKLRMISRNLGAALGEEWRQPCALALRISSRIRGAFRERRRRLRDCAAPLNLPKARAGSAEPWPSSEFCSEVATPAGFEPATYCFEGSCSIQLSYGIPQKVRATGAAPEGASLSLPACAMTSGLAIERRDPPSLSRFARRRAGSRPRGSLFAVRKRKQGGIRTNA